jgi:hypothetical protein
MLKTFEELCPGILPEELLADYVLDQWADDNRPPVVVLALCAMHWPDRIFQIDEEDGDDGLYYLADAYDTDTGESAEELLIEEYRRDEFPQFHRPFFPSGLFMQAMKGECEDGQKALMGKEDVPTLVKLAMNDPEGLTEEGALAGRWLEKLAWAAGATKEQTKNAADWAEVGQMALSVPPEQVLAAK